MTAAPTASANQRKYESANPLQQLLIRRFQGRVGDLLARHTFETVLDVGCGEGYLSRVLLDRFPGIRLTGVDVSAAAVEQAAIRCPEGRFLQADVAALRDWDERFDLVVCSEVLEHLEDPAGALRVLAARSGGLALLTVPWEPWFQLANFLRGKYLRTLGNHPEHIQHWTRRGFVREARRAFVPIHSETRFPWTIFVGRIPNGR